MSVRTDPEDGIKKGDAPDEKGLWMKQERVEEV